MATWWPRTVPYIEGSVSGRLSILFSKSWGGRRGETNMYKLAAVCTGDHVPTQEDVAGKPYRNMMKFILASIVPEM